MLKWSAVGWEIISLKSHKNEEEVGIRRKAGQKKKDRNNWWAEKKTEQKRWTNTRMKGDVKKGQHGGTLANTTTLHNLHVVALLTNSIKLDFSRCGGSGKANPSAP